MANGRINFGKQSGGTLGLVFPDGVSNTEVVLPESGTVATTADLNSALAGKANTIVANDSQIKTALNATGTAPIYACRAWVNFNGTGTVAIRASGNVSSITDNGSGNYTVNFITPMVDVNYSFPNGSYEVSPVLGLFLGIYAKTVSSISFNTHVVGSTGYNSSYDSTEITLSIIR